MATAVIAGSDHTCAILEGGDVRCFGVGNLGQTGYADIEHIGDDETPGSMEPVDVGGTVVDLVIGRHTCALLEDASVRCWGEGAGGRLGYGSVDNIGDDETPASAGSVDVGADVLAIAAGWNHTCAIVEGGAVRCWGQAILGRLGYGNMDDIGDDEAPASAGDLSLSGAMTQISAGSNHTCAITEAGEVQCWGFNGDGQLGYGDTQVVGDNETPDSVGFVDVGGVVKQVSAGKNHTCALLDNGAVRCWGDGELGQLGYGNVEDIGNDELPSAAGDVDLGGVKALSVNAAGDHTCVLLEDAEVKCWGPSDDGVLGTAQEGTIGDDETPASAASVELGGTATKITAGDAHNCALLDDGFLRCWGLGTFGRLGYGNEDTIGDDESPASAGNVPV
jgi:alpha-tubulin suppressor-like RCC1 family protein